MHGWYIRRTRSAGGSRRPGAGFAIPAMAVGGIVTLVLSCGEGAVEPAPPPAPVATTVTVNPSSAALSALGDTIRFSAEVRDQNGQVMAEAAVAWASSDATVAPVDASGLVTAAANGMATIAANSGSASGSAAVTVTFENPDSAALVALYEATTIGLRSWEIDTNWLSDQPLGTWYGVTTDEAGRVIELDLANNNLHRTIPAELGNLEKLRRLDLSDNGIEGILPAEIGNLRNLQELHLQGNVQLGYSASYSIFHGWTRTWYPIPMELGQLDELEWLNLSGTDFHGPIPQELGGVRNLTWLHLADMNYLDGPIPPELGQLSSLRHLDLSGSGLEGLVPPELGQLSNLRHLDLGDSRLEGSVPPEFGQLSNLRHLDLSDSRLDGVLPQELINVPLELFHWHGTQLCSPENGAFVEWLAGITDHEGMTCGQLSDRQALASFYSSTRGAAHWDTNTNWLSDEALGAWFGVTTDDEGRVMELSLPGNNVWGPIPQEFVHLHRLKVLNLNDNRVNGTLPAEIADLRDLEELSLGENTFLGSDTLIPAALGKLDKLELLDLSDTGFREEIPPELGQLSNLRHLDLSSSGLEGSVPPEFGRLFNLRHLDLSDSGLEGVLPQELINVPLELFHWNGTRLCSPENGAFAEWLAGITDHEGLTCGQFSDRMALVAFYEGTSGDSWWDIDTHWLSDRPLGTWYGVTTDDDGRVVELSLPGNSVWGSIPPELVRLQKLKVLNLNDNRVNGELPAEIGDLRDLEELNLGENMFLGSGTSIPAALGKLDKLKLLDLSGTRFEEEIPLELGNLRSLTRLDFSDMRWLDGSIPPDFGQLSNLRELDVSDNGMDGVLPQELINVPLKLFHWHGTRLCSPDNQEFQAWLRRIADHRGRSTCGATSAAVTQPMK
ncbi:MAG: Ig-like domain-containing protein [Gemmatimonadota bacterium]|nr:Ig-like domain-containing protein [Gemmatimonadota bacterium]MDE2863685.1 Ig-like domain-containing protein [Gemmatimonadota bacterium]